MDPVTNEIGLQVVGPVQGDLAVTAKGTQVQRGVGRDIIDRQYGDINRRDVGVHCPIIGPEGERISSVEV